MIGIGLVVLPAATVAFPAECLLRRTDTIKTVWPVHAPKACCRRVARSLERTKRLGRLFAIVVELGWFHRSASETYFPWLAV